MRSDLPCQANAKLEHHWKRSLRVKQCQGGRSQGSAKNRMRPVVKVYARARLQSWKVIKCVTPRVQIVLKNGAGAAIMHAPDCAAMGRTDTQILRNGQVVFLSTTMIAAAAAGRKYSSLEEPSGSYEITASLHQTAKQVKYDRVRWLE